MAETLYKPLTWDDLVNDPTLQNLPYKIELRGGYVVMSPAGLGHAILQANIIVELHKRAGGQVFTEVAVRTSGGVYAADVAWVSDSRRTQYTDDGPLPIAPEICVEVRSPSNSMAEMRSKARAYIEAGAEEVWIVQLDGTRETVRR